MYSFIITEENVFLITDFDVFLLYFLHYLETSVVFEQV